MTVQEFVDKYNAFNNDALKEKYLKEIVNKTYVPFRDKMDICKRAADVTLISNTIIDGKKKEFFSSMSALRYIAFEIILIENYTDIVFQLDAARMDDFELLDQYELNDKIIQQIPDREYQTFEMLLNMYVDDCISNYNNFIDYLNDKIEATSMAFNVILDGIKEFTNDIQALQNNENDAENINS